MYPSPEQLALLKECQKLWGKDNVRMRMPTERDRNLRVICQGRAGTHRMTYAPDGTILDSSIDVGLFPLPPPAHTTTNALDN